MLMQFDSGSRSVRLTLAMGRGARGHIRRRRLHREVSQSHPHCRLTAVDDAFTFSTSPCRLYGIVGLATDSSEDHERRRQYPLFQWAISISAASASRCSFPNSLGSRRSESSASAKDALFLSVHTGELSNPMNGSYGTRGSAAPRSEPLWQTPPTPAWHCCGHSRTNRSSVHQITNDALLVGDIAQNLRSQCPLLGVGRVTQDAPQLLQVPGRVAYETLLNRSRRRVVGEGVSCESSSAASPRWTAAMKASQNWFPAWTMSAAKTHASSGCRAKVRGSSALLFDAHIDDAAARIATDEIGVCARHPRQCREPTLRLCQNRWTLIAHQRDGVAFLERQCLTSLAFRDSPQSIKVDDPDLELLAGQLARAAQNHQGKKECRLSWSVHVKQRRVKACARQPSNDNASPAAHQNSRSAVRLQRR